MKFKHPANGISRRDIKIFGEIPMDGDKPEANKKSGG